MIAIVVLFIGLLHYPVLSPVAMAQPQLNEDRSLRIAKLEPPNWWVGFGQEVMLLISGDNLDQVEVTCDYPGVKIARAERGASAHYLFVWMEIAPDARPGVVLLGIHGKFGAATAQFPLSARADQQGRFQGVSSDDVVYMIMPDRFADGDLSNDEPAQAPGSYDLKQERAYHGGDLRGIVDHLSYLHGLGVTTLWISPIYDNDNPRPPAYHGYHAVDFYSVDPHLGTLGDFQKLVEAAHGLGMKIVLDVVVNHTGSASPWLTSIPTTHWFHGNRTDHLDSTASSFDPLVDPHSVAKQYRDVLNGWFAGLPDLNQADPFVRQYLIENSLWWAETSGLDGFRLDTFPYVPRVFWSAWHQALFREYPHLTTIGEVFNSDPSITAYFAGGRPQFDGIDTGVSTLFDYPLYFALRDVVINHAPMGKIVHVLQDDWMYPHPDALVTFFGNHDVPRFISEPGSSAQKLNLAFSLLLTLRGTPQIYTGDEIGMAGGNDPDNRHDFPGGFPGDRHNAFDLSGRNRNEEAVFEHVRALLRLRDEHPALRHGRQWNIDYDDNHYIYLRETESEKIMIVFNNDVKPYRFHSGLADTPLAGSSSIIPLFKAGPAKLLDNNLELQAAPGSVAIYQVK
jgi:glycosidase